MAPKTPEEIKQEQIKKAKDKAMGKTMPETIAVDISTINTKDKVGGQMSSRQKINVKLEDGRVVEGYYTEDTFTDYDQQYADYMEQLTSGADPKINELGSELFNKLKNYSPMELFRAMHDATEAENYQQMLDNGLFTSDTITSMQFFYNLCRNEALKKQAENKNEPQKKPNKYGVIEYDEDFKKYYSLLDDYDFRKVLQDFGAKAYSLASGIIGNIRKGQLSDDKRNVNRRNNAVYGVSSLLGHSDLICQSVNMTTVVKEGTQKNGSFMVNAKGTAIRDVYPYMANGELVPMEYSGKGKRDLSRLQVLDFLCANPDRHSENFFYDIKYKAPTDDGPGKFVIDGLQGIDNDLSFGRIRGEGDGIYNPDNVYGYMSNIGDIKVIDKEQKEAILQPDFAEGFENQMRLLGLSQEEIEAGLFRLNSLKDKLTAGKDIRVIDGEKEWEALDTTPLEVSVDEVGNIWNISNDIINYSAREEDRRSIEEFLKQSPQKPLTLSEAKNESAGLLFSSQLKDLKTLKEEFDKTNPEKASKEFKKMYDSLGSLIQRIDSVKDKDTLSDIEFNKISMGFKKVMDNTQEYIRLKPKNPRSQNGKDRLNCAKNMLAQATQGRHMVLEENTAAFSRRMTAAYNKFNQDYKALVDIDKALQDKNNPPTKQYYADSIRAINSMSKANPDDAKLQFASAILQEKLLRGLGKEACQAMLTKEDLGACFDILKKNQRNSPELGEKQKNITENIAEKKDDELSVIQNL